MRIGLSAKLIGAFLVVSLCFFSVLALTFTNKSRRLLETSFLERAKVAALALDSSVSDISELDDRRRLFSVLQKTIWLNPDILRIEVGRIIGDGLITVVSSDGANIGKPAALESAYFHGQSGLTFWHQELREERILKVIAPINIAKQKHGVFQVYFTKEKIYDEIKSIIINQVAIFAYFTFVFCVVIYLTVNHFAIKPVKNLRRAVEQFGQHGSNWTMDIATRDEIGELSKSFHQMTIDLEDLHARLIQSQKLEAVGRLGSGIAHDFNNLLMVIHGNLELIADRLADPEAGRMVQSAINASRRGAELTQRLLAFSRKQTLMPRVIDLNELVADMSGLLRPTLGQSIEVELATGEDPLRCRADPSQLETAILNLAINARDAMPNGGKLTIKTATVKRDGTDVSVSNDVSPGEYVMISVSDTGTGMSENVVDHAFEPFFTTKDVGAGSGLGLSMVYGFINQSGGSVTIDSTEGVGTTVNLYLPRSVENCALAQQRGEAQESLPQAERILVVEDEPNVRALTVRMLADLGYETLEAADGKEAIEILRSAPGIDLLFSDVVLPAGMSGIKVAEDAIDLLPGIKILLTSGYPETVLDQHCPVNEEIHLIKKPFRKATLAQTVRAILDQPAG